MGTIQQLAMEGGVARGMAWLKPPPRSKAKKRGREGERRESEWGGKWEKA